jgi:PAS domain S-box-containing protein
MPINNPSAAQQRLLFWSALVLMLIVGGVSFATTNSLLPLGLVVSAAGFVWLFIIRNRESWRRRQAEDELKALNSELEHRVGIRTAELERSRELVDAVIENMPDAVFLKDARDGFRYVLINSSAERLIGQQRADVLGRTDEDLCPADLATDFLDQDRAVAETGEQRLFPERVLDTSDGSRTVESRKVAIADGDGVRFVLGILHDITEQRSLEDQLRQSQRMDAVGRLTGGIAHDFNNLLAVIIGNLDLLREQLEDATECAEMADEALAAAAHGADLIKRLLAFARKQRLEPVAVHLNQRLPSITGLLRRTLGETVDLRVQTADDLWPALVDPSQADDALINLAINARDAMPAGGTLSIETSNVVLDGDYAAQHVEVTPGDYVMLAVSDSGTGMPEEVIARAFEPFFTTKPEGKGTGLGLSQVYGWIKQSGGHIKIYSEAGHGTTIKLYLPRAGTGELSAAAAPAAATPTGDERVFVVEDNPKVRTTVRRQLCDLGYSTVEADNGASALAMVESGLAFDLLLTDMVMPGGMTGYDLARHVRSLRPQAKILFTSGYTELAAPNGGAERMGAFLSKPYRKDELARAVRTLLDAR